MPVLTLAEIKLELIRAIDRMTEEELVSVRQLIEDIREHRESVPSRRKLGALQGGLLYMAPDFDASLEDFDHPNPRYPI